MLNSVKTIIAGVSDPDGTDPVFRHALSLAERLRASLHVIHAYTLPVGAVAFDLGAIPVGESPVPGPGLAQMEELEESLRNGLRALAKTESPATTVHVHTKLGPPAGAIARLHEEIGADLVLLGGTRHHGISRAVLGTTAGRVLREVPVPVLVLRAPPTASRVLLTTDLSDLSAEACIRGIGIAQALRTDVSQSIRCLHVAALPFGDLPATSVELEARARDALGLFLEGIPELPAGAEIVVRSGAPSEEIVRESREWGADLTVVGTHGRAGLSRLVLGSAAEGVVRDLESNVLVIPPATANGLEDGSERHP